MGWLSKALKKAERWLRRKIVGPAKQTLAAELAVNLDQIDDAIEQAILRYAASVGGLPLATFVSVAIANLGLSDRVNQFVADLLGKLGAGTSRSVQPGKGREAAARDELASLRAAIQEEAAKA
jgi:hypothetical protein